MADEKFDPFAPQEAGAKMKFGRLKLFANPVTLETGASYTVKGIHDRDGNVKEWRGKKIVKDSKRFHLILHMFCKDKDGNEYEAMRDHLNNDKPYKDVVHPALASVFGVDTAKWPREQYVYVQAEEVPTGETFDSNRDTNEDGSPKKVNRTTFKVIGKFANEAACEAAETKYFEGFSNGHEAEGASGPTFSADMLKTFKKNAKKGAESIVNDLVDDDIIEQFGRDAVIEAVKAAIA